VKPTTIIRIAFLLLLIAAVGSPAFAQALDGFTFTTIYIFDPTNGAIGDNPRAGLIQSSDGNLYGTTCSGGPGGGDGTVFKFTPQGTLSTVYSFIMTPGANGFAPCDSLVQGSDGNFYGTTEFGGNLTINSGIGPRYGTVFKLTPTGTLTTLHSFSVADGSEPWADLVQGRDGNFYGTTLEGGSSYSKEYAGAGTVFIITASGSLTTLHSFGVQTGDGNTPGGGLIQGNDGNFYGVTGGGGAYECGTVYKIAPSGAETVLHSFGAPKSGDGTCPTGCLAEGSDGNFYGTTGSGANGYGTIFRITPSGALTTLHSFLGTDGNNAAGCLLQSRDGNFYGTTRSGGTDGDGTIFKITLAGAFTTIYSLTGNDGLNGGLVQGIDGSLYGTTYTCHPSSEGSIVKLTPPAASTYALWNNSGTASLWHIPVSGSIISAAFGPYSGWTPTSLASDTRGNAYILWITTTGAASVFKIAPNLTLTTSQSFGPYTGWTAKAISVGPDGNVHLLWNGPGNASSVFNIVLGSTFTTQAYGPIAGWQATQIAMDGGNNTRVLWNNTSTNAASLWNITSGGTVTSQSFGPYTGYKAQSLVAGPANLPRMIWNYTSTNAASLWQMLPLGNETSTALGPVSGWAVTGLAVNWGGDSDVLWTNATTGQASIWDVTSTGTHTSASYGPYSGWKAVAIAPGP